MTLLKQEGYGNVCFFPCTQNAVLLHVRELSQFEMLLSDGGHAICRRNATALLQVLQVDEVGTLGCSFSAINGSMGRDPLKAWPNLYPVASRRANAGTANCTDSLE